MFRKELIISFKCHSKKFHGINILTENARKGLNAIITGKISKILVAAKSSIQNRES